MTTDLEDMRPARGVLAGIALAVAFWAVLGVAMVTLGCAAPVTYIKPHACEHAHCSHDSTVFVLPSEPARCSSDSECESLDR